MFPVLFTVSGYPINTYGVFVSLAHLLAIGGVLLRVRRSGRSIDSFVDVIFAVMIAGLVGARTGYILEHPEDFSSADQWFQLWKGGLSLFSGLLMSFPAYLLMLIWRRLPIWETTDLLVPILPFCLALIRLGCFGAGCCYGFPTQLPWGIKPISNLTPFYLAGENLHPTQIYESLFLFALFALLLNKRIQKLPPGAPTCFFLLAYGMYRLSTNPLRADLEYFSGWPFGPAQAGAAILTLLAAACLLWRLRSKKRPA